MRGVVNNAMENYYYFVIFIVIANVNRGYFCELFVSSIFNFGPINGVRDQTLHLGMISTQTVSLPMLAAMFNYHST